MSDSSWLWLINFIKELVHSEYTGKIEINFFKGGITNINKFESIKPLKNIPVSGKPLHKSFSGNEE